MATTLQLKTERWHGYKLLLADLPTLPRDDSDQIPDAGKLTTASGFDAERPLNLFKRERIMDALGLSWTIIDSDMSGKGTHGFSTGEGKIAIARNTKFPTAVLWHELAHVLLGHTGYAQVHVKHNRPLYEQDKRVQAECEAELVAYLLCYVYGYNEAKAKSRSYIMTWAERDMASLKACDFTLIYETVDQIKALNVGKEV